MASRGERRWAFAAVVIVIPLTAAATGSACGERPSQAEAGAADSGGDPAADLVIEESTDEDVRMETETDADAADPCAPLEAGPGCVHPQVVAQCDGGWCFIPHGCFIMGSPPCEFNRGLYDEDQVQTTLTHDFEIQQTELTQAQWVALGYANPSMQHLDAGDGGYVYGDCLDPQCPVGNVTLEEQMAAANVLSSKHQPALPQCYALTGCAGSVGQGMACSGHSLLSATTYDCAGYRLPTEAEWEYAARAGTTTTVYSGDIVPTQACAPDPNVEKIAWYCYNAKGFSQHVAQKLPNAWGLYDMSGNATEWTSSQYNGNGYGPGPLVDPMPALGSAALIDRGGIANYNAAACRSAARWLYNNFGVRDALGGFRLVRTLGGLDAGSDQ